MPRKTTSPAVYLARARKLRGLGYQVAYSPARKGTKTAGHKAAVSRLWNDRAVFYATDPDKHNLEFHRFRSAKAKREWRGFVADEQVFPGGFFFQRPAGVEKGKFKIRRNAATKGKRASVTVTTSDRRKIRDVIVMLDMKKLADDSELELANTLAQLERPAEMLLTVNGFDADTNRFEDLESFNRYLSDDDDGLIRRLKKAKFNFKKWGKKVFGVRLVYTPKGRKKKEGEGQIFDFKTGGIFSAKSKKVYGKRKFENREKFLERKGKRKGK